MCSQTFYLSKTDATISACLSILGWGQFNNTLQVTVLQHQFVSNELNVLHFKSIVDCILPLMKHL